MGKYSKEQIARIVSAFFLIGALFSFKPSVSEGEVVKTVGALVAAWPILVALGMDIFGYFRRLSKGDVTVLGARK